MYDTREDNLIIEAPVIFGSGLQVRVSAKLRVPGTGYAVYLPVEVSSIQVSSSPAAPACHNTPSRWRSHAPYLHNHWPTSPCPGVGVALHSGG